MEGRTDGLRDEPLNDRSLPQNVESNVGRRRDDASAGNRFADRRTVDVL